jgi:hypothetical protein
MSGTEEKFSIEIVLDGEIAKLDDKTYHKVKNHPICVSKLLSDEIDEDEKRYIRELKTLKNDNILQLFLVSADCRYIVHEEFMMLKEFKGSIILRNFMVQMSDGISFLHARGYNLGSFNPTNIAVALYDESTPKFKITNIDKYEESDRARGQSMDLKQFGTTLSGLKDRDKGDKPIKSEKILVVQLCTLLTANKFVKIENVKKHPSFNTPEQNLHFLLNFAILLENSPLLYTKLKKLPKNKPVFKSDWTKTIDDDFIVVELKVIKVEYKQKKNRNFGKSLENVRDQIDHLRNAKEKLELLKEIKLDTDLPGLILQIRNLVSVRSLVFEFQSIPLSFNLNSYSRQFIQRQSLSSRRWVIQTKSS